MAGRGSERRGIVTNYLEAADFAADPAADPRPFYAPEGPDRATNVATANAQNEPAVTFLSDGR